MAKPSRPLKSTIVSCAGFPSGAGAETPLALYAQDQSMTAAAYDLASKRASYYPDDPELAELLARLSYERKEYARTRQLLEETARTKDSTPILCFTWACLSSKQANERSTWRS